MSKKNTINLEHKGILDLDIVNVSLSKVVKVNIALTFIHHGEKEEKIFKILLEEDHPAFKSLTDEGKSAHVNSNNILEIEGIKKKIEDFVNQQLSEKYRE